MAFSQTLNEIESNKRARDLISKNEIGQLIKELWSLHGLNEAIANYLISQDQGWEVAARISSFKADDNPRIARSLITANGKNAEAVIVHLQQFEQVDHIDIARQMLNTTEVVKMILLINKFDQFSISDRIKFVDLLVENGFGREVEMFGAGIGQIKADLIDCGPRGSGTQIVGYVTTTTYLDKNIPQQPKLVKSIELDIDASCVKFKGDTPRKSIDAMLENMENRPEQWSRASRKEREAWTADVIEAADIMAIEINRIDLSM